jgi:hypothetical protein
MGTPGNDPQVSQSVVDSVREKLQRFYGELTDDERVYVEASMRQALTFAATPTGTGPGIEGPAVLAWNKSSKPLVVWNIDTSRCQVKENLFDGQSPQVGDVLAPGDRYAFTWTLYFLGSCIDIAWRAKDGSGGALTHMGFGFVTGGWEYGCYNVSGSLACANPSNNPHDSPNNVEIVDR